MTQGRENGARDVQELKMQNFQERLDDFGRELRRVSESQGEHGALVADLSHDVRGLLNGLDALKDVAGSQSRTIAELNVAAKLGAERHDALRGTLRWVLAGVTLVAATSTASALQGFIASHIR